ncbi:hypothetical protein DAPPUDRAFT_299860 [Daphnia pulex]|uniref:Uncharacterized protein n=1 Tax=Daphnia pulex TaxID=6669 RepID=E9FSB8_DAPPU|nr:hypothetical protein DAPPUDRAFT_299860 [Daphnia pulex]|eukprot:EFX90006.1 hypothetical protein DAPPUDRAFT_299860 [Daphnia pulex]
MRLGRHRLNTANEKIMFPQRKFLKNYAPISKWDCLTARQIPRFEFFCFSFHFERGKWIISCRTSNSSVYTMYIYIYKIRPGVWGGG